ncbi:MAG: histidine kinase [Hydrogenoanaerobacterium sp.]
MELANGCLEIFAALIILILLVSMRSERPADTFEKRLTAIVVCHMAVLLLDSARWLLFQHTDLPVLMVVLSVAPTILSLIGNGIFIVFVVSFLEEREPTSRKAKTTFISLFILAISIWAAFILLNGIQSAATMQTNHDAMRFSWAYWAGHFGWAAVCVLGIEFVLRCRKELKAAELLSLLSYCVFPLIALFLRFFWDGPQIFLSTSLSIIWIHAVMQREQRVRFLEQESQLTQSRMAILLSQIQPHFLYNALTAICGLCDENPKEAKRVTAEFADYLRHNLDSLTQSKPVPFEDELEHTKVYLGIEQKRFEERLRIVYDIKRADFCVPSLTIQPLVENAVKHGIVKRKNGGTVTISTRERESCYEIIIADDGVGFDINEPQTDPDTHIGIQNVRDRLWSMCGGTLDIKSEVGKGTAATIKMPKGDTDS